MATQEEAQALAVECEAQLKAGNCVTVHLRDGKSICTGTSASAKCEYSQHVWRIIESPRTRELIPVSQISHISISVKQA